MKHSALSLTPSEASARFMCAMKNTENRYRVSGQAGAVNGRRWAVLDSQDRQGGKGMKRVEFHRTPEAARAAARRLNRGSSE